MPQIKPEVEASPRIKVIGVGGSGKNAVNHMVRSKVKGIDFIVVNTDTQDLHHSEAKKKIHIGKNLTKGLGTGMNPEMGKRAVEETIEEVMEAIKGSDMIFVAGGMGGGTGTGAAPVIAKTAKELGALTVGIVTKPFSFEGQHRMRLAEKGIEELRQHVDALIVIPNDRLLATISRETLARDAFSICDDVLKSAVEGISDLITTPGDINIDFADIRAVMGEAGGALMGIGRASGDKRAEDAARAAINSPLLDVNINGARGVLFSIAGGNDLTMFEINDAARLITESVDPNAKIIFGTVFDEKLKKGEIKITVIASGFPDGFIRRPDPPRPITPYAPAPTYQPPYEPPHAVYVPPPSPPQSPPEPKKSEEAKGHIFNSVFSRDKEQVPPPQPEEERGAREPTPTPTSHDNQNHSAQGKPQERQTVDPGIIIQGGDDDDDSDDEWGAVPAFLRRSKLK